MQGQFLVQVEGVLLKAKKNTLLDSLEQIVQIFKECAAPDEIVETTVLPHSSGRYKVDYKISKNSKVKNPLLGSAQNKDTFENFLDFLKLLKFLQGEPAVFVKKEGDEIIISNERDQELEANLFIFELYQKNIKIISYVQKAFKILADDEYIKLVRIGDQYGKPLIQFFYDEFKVIANAERSDAGQTVEKEKVSVQLSGTCYATGSTLGVIFNGRKLSAKMADEDFRSQSPQDLMLEKGDCLLCDVEISQVFNDQLNSYIDDSIYITKVHEHKPCAVQQGFAF